MSDVYGLACTIVFLGLVLFAPAPTGLRRWRGQLDRWLADLEPHESSRPAPPPPVRPPAPPGAPLPGLDHRRVPNYRRHRPAPLRRTQGLP